MATRAVLDHVLDQLTDGRLNQVLDYARYLSLQEEQGDWRQFGRQQFATAYGDDEPEYTLNDIKRNNQP
mgnify:CR=1 FL=1